MAEQAEPNELDRWVAALQQAILEREQAMYSAMVLAEARHPYNMGVMDAFDGYGLVTGPCGDTMEFFVQLDGEHVARATFMTDGCGPTVACGSMLSRMVEGKGLMEGAEIEAADVIIALDGLPPEHIHCATLAVETLQQALADCQPEGKGE
ncbi:MAG: iron-sulfur cluster assembly scaffold protein [Anaerolineae bacterium]|nr:iron-sulfur cluster assembly scaffold protein [Anaerolineae bacterium]